jgi:hypothetical protein
VSEALGVEGCVMQVANTLRGIYQKPNLKDALESRMQGNLQVRFGGGWLEKDRLRRHLAGHLPYASSILPRHASLATGGCEACGTT